MSSIQRWVRKRQFRLLVLSLAVFVVMIFYVINFPHDIMISERYYRPFTEKCLSTTATKLVKDQCVNFTNGLAYGSLCNALCVNRNILIEHCIHHGNTYILMAKHDGTDIVIKKKKPQDLGFLYEYLNNIITKAHNISTVRKAFLKTISEEIRSSFGAASARVFANDIDSFLKTILGKVMDSLTVKEMQSALLMVAQSELVMFALHRNLKSFPKIIGTCGEFYAMESIQPYSRIFPEVLSVTSWVERVRIASGFLKLIQDFQHTLAGSLSHCDIQESNFGLTKNFDVKAIDVDLVFSKEKIEEMLSQPLCQSDLECSFFDCHSECDTKNSRCTTKSITNNLQVFCRDILYPKWPLTGLLSSKVPVKVRARLIQILLDCRSESFGKFSNTHPQVKRTIKELAFLLSTSLIS